MQCRNCAAVNASGAIFCSQCGTRLVPETAAASAPSLRGERRPGFVLLADELLLERDPLVPAQQGCAEAGLQRRARIQD